MIEDIETHLFDLLAGDARLFRGNALLDIVWQGVLRVETGDKPEKGYVNLFETPYVEDATTHRPAIYLGTKGMEAQDRLAYETCAAPADLTEGRILTIPLFIAVQAPTKIQAKRERNQLRQNIKAILFDHRIETDHWYWLEMSSGNGPIKDNVWVSSTGAGEQQVAEAMATLPIAIHYNWNGASPA